MIVSLSSENKTRSWGESEVVDNIITDFPEVTEMADGS